MANKRNTAVSSAPGSSRALLLLTIVGLLARVALAAVSRGTNDVDTFMRLGREVNQWGLLATYQHDRDLNHPPIPSFWASAIYRLAPDRPFAFSFLFKWPSILADAATAWLLWKIARGRLRRRSSGTLRLQSPTPERHRIGTPRVAEINKPQLPLALAAMYAWSLDAILVSGHHCNTDPIYAFLCLLSVYLMADRSRYFLGGLALGAAVNVKLTPILLASPLLLSCRDWKQAGRFAAGLSLGALPFLPILLAPPPVRDAFRVNALAYNSSLDRWGLQFLLTPIGPDDTLPAEYDVMHSAAGYYYFHGRYVILALVAAWSIISRLLGRWNLYEVAAVTLAIFLILSPGFGVQYTVMVLPLLFATRHRLANVYGAAAGLFLLVVYFLNWTGEFPLFSEFHSLFPMPSPWFGLIAWGVLIAFVGIAMIRPSGLPSSGLRDNAA